MTDCNLQDSLKNLLNFEVCTRKRAPKNNKTKWKGIVRRCQLFCKQPGKNNFFAILDERLLPIRTRLIVKNCNP